MAYSPEFSITTRSVDGYFVVSVQGELDMVTAPQLEQALAGCSDGVPIIADLRNVTFLASHGIRALFRERSGGQVALVVEPESHITRLLDIVDNNHQMPVFPGLQAAIQGVTEPRPSGESPGEA
jgi:anti-anti-sigma factor